MEKTGTIPEAEKINDLDFKSVPNKRIYVRGIIIRFCLYCGKEIGVRSGQIKTGRGKYCSKLCKDNSQRGKDRNEITKSKIKEKRKFQIFTEETKRKLSEKRKNMIFSDETRRKIGFAHKGEKCNFWRGGVTPINRLIRMSGEIVFWRKKIFVRDNYTCQRCFIKGKTLNAHHIKPFSLYPELRFEINNGLTLCKNCHIKTDSFAKRYDLIKI